MKTAITALLVWFKYNQVRVVLLCLFTVIVIGMLTDGSRREQEYATVGIFFIPLFLIPEIKKYSRIFIDFYKKL